MTYDTLRTLPNMHRTAQQIGCVDLSCDAGPDRRGAAARTAYCVIDVTTSLCTVQARTMDRMNSAACGLLLSMPQSGQWTWRPS